MMPHYYNYCLNFCFFLGGLTECRRANYPPILIFQFFRSLTTIELCLLISNKPKMHAVIYHCKYYVPVCK